MKSYSALLKTKLRVAKFIALFRWQGTAYDKLLVLLSFMPSF